MLMRIILSLLFVAAAFPLLAEGDRTIKTLDGQIFTNATIIDLCPTGIVVSIPVGVTNIAYDNLPKDLQNRYGYDTNELSKFLTQGLDGTYGPSNAYAGVVIELNKGRFSYTPFSDVFVPGEENRLRPLHGFYTIVGNWVTFDNPKVRARQMVITVINGQLAFVTRYDYWHWKNTGRVELGEVLYRR